MKSLKIEGIPCYMPESSWNQDVGKDLYFYTATCVDKKAGMIYTQYGKEIVTVPEQLCLRLIRTFKSNKIMVLDIYIYDNEEEWKKTLDFED